MPVEFVFHAKISRLSEAKYGIYIPRELHDRIKQYHGRRVIVRVTIPDT